MKKLITIISILLILSGCSVYKSTPKKINSQRSEFFALQEKEKEFPYKK